MESSQSDLRQTTDPIPADAGRRPGAVSHLHLTEECREQLLSMSATTADRFLRSQRKKGPRGTSTTRTGTLLKNQIPIRTFADWNETQPGFLEVDRARPLWQRSRRRLLVHVNRYSNLLVSDVIVSFRSS
jgi:hypothetical protein